MRSKKLFKFITSGLTAVFIFTSTVWSGDSSVYRIQVPESAGKVSQRYKGDSDKTIIHIQDAHKSFEAQKNIAVLIENLIDNQHTQVVGVEGAVGELPIKGFRKFSIPEARRAAAWNYMKQGIFSGSEYAAISHEDAIALFGIEDQKLFESNFKTFSKASLKRDKILDTIEEIEEALNELKAPIYDGELKIFDDEASLYEKGQLDLIQFFGILYSCLQKLEIEASEFLQVNEFFGVTALEQTIDFKRAEEEKQSLIQILDDGEIESKISKSTPNEINQFLRNKALEKSISLAAFNEFEKLSQYTRQFEGIHFPALLKEVNQLKERIRFTLSKSEESDALIRQSENLKILKKVVKLEAEKEDAELLRENPEKFQLNHFISFIEAESSKHQISLSEIKAPKDYSSHQELINQFYEEATLRDQALVNNLLAHMESQQEKKAILLAGGFHSDGIADFLKREKINYLTITPNISSLQGGLPYHEKMTGNLFPVQSHLVSHITAMATYIHASPSEVERDFARDSVVAALQLIVTHEVDRERVQEALSVLGSFEEENLDSFIEDIRTFYESFVDRLVRQFEGESFEASDIEEALLGEELLYLFSQIYDEAVFSSDKTKRELLENRYAQFRNNFSGNEWVIAADGPKIRATDHYYGKSATDAFIALLRNTVTDWALDYGLAANIPKHGSDEFSFGLMNPSGDLQTDREKIEVLVSYLIERLEDEFSRLSVISFRRVIDAETEEEIYGLDGVEFVDTAGTEEYERSLITTVVVENEHKETVLSRLEESILPRVEEGVISRLGDSAAKLGEVRLLTEPIRIPYLPMGAAHQPDLADEEMDLFDGVAKKADKIQEDHKDIATANLVTFQGEEIRERRAEDTDAPAVTPPRTLTDHEREILGLLKSQGKKLNQDYQIEDYYGVYSRRSLGSIINDVFSVSQEDREPGIYVARYPPNVFYIVHVKEDGSVSLIKLDAGYSAGEDSKVGQVFRREIEGASGRDVISFGGGRSLNTEINGGDPLYGFKGINSAFSHADGNLVIAAIAYEIYRVFGGNFDHLDNSDKIDELQKRLNEYFTDPTDPERSFKTTLFASVILGDDIGADAYMADSMISAVDNLIEARDVMDPQVLTTGKNLLKKYRNYADPGTLAEIDTQIMRIKGHRKKRAKNDVLDKTDPVLATKARRHQDKFSLGTRLGVAASHVNFLAARAGGEEALLSQLNRLQNNDSHIFVVLSNGLQSLFSQVPEMESMVRFFEGPHISFINEDVVKEDFAGDNVVVLANQEEIARGKITDKFKDAAFILGFQLGNPDIREKEFALLIESLSILLDAAKEKTSLDAALFSQSNGNVWLRNLEDVQVPNALREEIREYFKDRETIAVAA